MCKQKEQTHGIAHTQRYILNSFIKTGFCWGTACHDRADDANARFPRAREGLLVAVRRACMVQGQVVDVVGRFRIQGPQMRSSANHSACESHLCNAYI